MKENLFFLDINSGDHKLIRRPLGPLGALVAVFWPIFDQKTQKFDEILMTTTTTSNVYTHVPVNV